MGKVIACIDGSKYAGGVSHFSAWIHKRTHFSVSLLHVLAPHSQMKTTIDMTGQIGLGANATLLESLTKRDEEHGKLEFEKSQLMLDCAKEELTKNKVKELTVLHRRGSLVEIIADLETQADLIVMGKSGEKHDSDVEHLGSNLESVIRAVHTPIFVSSLEKKTIQTFLMAYDGSPSANKAIEFIINNPLLQGLTCHLLQVGEPTQKIQIMLQQVENRLKSAGFNAQAKLQQGKSVKAMVFDYMKTNPIDLLVIGAYGHSKIRSLILGSTTTALVRESQVPVLLFR